MPCEPFTLPGGGRGFICSRSRSPRPRPRCTCGRPATLQCDTPAKRKSGTCDKHTCATCSLEVGPDKHLCATHAAEHRAAQPALF